MKTLSLIIYLFFIQLFLNKVYAIENKILIKVNEDIITSLDVYDEIKYLNLINNNFGTLNKEKKIEIAKNSIIREKIKKIEILKRIEKIDIDTDLLNNVAVSNFQKLGVKSVNDFENYFKKGGIDPELIRQKISIELLWNRLIYTKFIKNVKIDKENIKQELINNNMQKEFLLLEILFNLKEGENLQNKFNSIKKIIEEKNFSEAALTFSVSNTSKQGGRLGWIKESALSVNIKNQLNKLNKNGYTNPIVIPGGFLILMVENIRKVEKKFELDKEIDLIVRQKENEQLTQFSNIYFSKIKKDIKINEL